MTSAGPLHVNTHQITAIPASTMTPPTILTAIYRSREKGSPRKVERRKETPKRQETIATMMGPATAAALPTVLPGILQSRARALFERGTGFNAENA